MLPPWRSCRGFCPRATRLSEDSKVTVLPRREGGSRQQKAGWWESSWAHSRGGSLAPNSTLHKYRDGNETLQVYSSNHRMHKLTRLWKRDPLTEKPFNLKHLF